MGVGGRNAVLVLMVGVPEAGRSRLARRLATSIGARLLQSDDVRVQLFPERRYSGGANAAVYGWCHSLIRAMLAAGSSVVFDATNLEERVRRRAYDVADSCGARLVIVWACAPAQLVQQRRLRWRAPGDEDDWPAALSLARAADPVVRPHLVVNTATDTTSVLRRIAALAAP